MIRKKYLNKAFKNYFNLGSTLLVDLNCFYLSLDYTVCHIDLNCFSLNINLINNKECFKVLVNISHCCILEGN